MKNMSTHALIGVKNANKTITAIFCHFDGHPRTTGAKLRQYFKTPAIAASLVAKGDIRSVGECLATTESYKEMRNDDRPAQKFTCMQDFLDEICGYGYLFDPITGKWSGYDSQEAEVVIPAEYNKPPPVNLSSVTFHRA